MRILFFPSDLGGGFGHIGRCLVLARAARERTHISAFVSNDSKYVRHIQKDFQVFRSPAIGFRSPLRRLIKRSFGFLDAGKAAVFTEISGLNYQVVRDGLMKAKGIEAIARRYRGWISSFSPDIIVSDTNLLAGIAARADGIPVVQLVRYASHPATAGLMWWKPPSSVMRAPQIQALFNPLLETLGLNPVRKAEDLLTGDLYLIPSIPEIEPIPAGPDTLHVGHLLTSVQETPAPLWLKSIHKNIPLIYITIGGGAGLVGNTLFFKTIIQAFEHQEVQIIVSTGRGTVVPRQPKRLANIQFFDWVPGRALIERADLVIFHGGYSTMMEVLSAGKPSLVIPFHSEQEGNGRRMERLGCGRVLKLSRQDPLLVERQWDYGSFNYLIQNRFDLAPETLSGEAGEILNHRQYGINARLLQNRIRQYGGAPTAIEWMETLMANQRRSVARPHGSTGTAGE